MYEQLIQPNLSVVGQPEECLVYVREIFSIPAKYPTAIAGWEGAAYKHNNATPPTDVSVPVWFSWNTFGHVAVSVPGKGVYTTSAQGDKVLGSVQGVASLIGGTYLGWSEDVDGERVAQPAPVPAPTPSGQTIYLSPENNPFHAYNPGGPYNPNNPADYKGLINPKEFGGLTYPIVESLGNGVYRINSQDYGLVDIWTNGSTVTVS